MKKKHPSKKVFDYITIYHNAFQQLQYWPGRILFRLELVYTGLASQGLI